jgi:hypothetical protein
MNKRKSFELVISPTDDLSGVDFNSFVEAPAHEKRFHYFGEQPKPVFFANDEKRIVTGVMIAANKLIPRYDEKLGFYDVFFTAPTIHQIILKFHKQMNFHNVNLDHSQNKVVDGVYMFESYQVNKDKGLFPIDVPDAQDGDWVSSYKIENDNVWKDIKEGKFTGFSVEIWANHIERNLFKNLKTETMSKEKMTFAQRVADFKKKLFGEIEFAEVTTDAGLVLSYEGELAVGTAVMVKVEEDMTPATEGAYVLTGEMEGVSLILDEAGVVLEIIQPSTEDEPTEVEVAMAALVDEIKSLKKEKDELKKENEKFSVEFASFKEQFENFAKTPAAKPTATFPQGKNPRAEYFRNLLTKNQK